MDSRRGGAAVCRKRARVCRSRTIVAGEESINQPFDDDGCARVTLLELFQLRV
jgi:hypothetical protein